MNAHKEQLAKDYMTIEPLEDGLTISLYSYDLEYNKGDGWNTLTRKSVLTLNRGELCSFRAKLSGPVGEFQIQKSFNLKGNCLSLIFGDEAAQNINSRLPDGVFSYLFSGADVVEVDKHFLPSMSLSSRCYTGMFSHCDLLTVAPELPATQVKYDCYSYMFQGAVRLSSAPRLPATILTDLCYYCMFIRCNTLNHIEMMATDISAENCLLKWVSGVSATGTFIKNPEATWDVVGVDGVPEGWTVKFDGEEEGGGKEVNVLTLRPYVEGSKITWLSVDYSCSYLPTSTIEVSIKTTGLDGECKIYITEGTLTGSRTDVDLSPSSAEIEIISFEPMEDDNYIYEIVVEY